MKLHSALGKIRRNREEIRRNPTKFEQFRGEYEQIFLETRDVAGNDVMRSLVEWITESTTASKQLPTPAEVRSRAKELCEKQGQEIPPESSLQLDEQ